MSEEINSQWLDKITAFTKHLVKSGQTVLPVFFMRHGTETDIIPLSNLPDKDMWSQLMRYLLLKFKPDEYVFISESWIKKFDTKKKDEKILSEEVAMGLKQVHDLENKSECIVVVYGDRLKGENTGLIQFERKGKDTKISDIEWLPKNISGRFSNLWNPFKGESNIN